MGRAGLWRLFEFASVALVVAAVVTVGGGWLARDVMPRLDGDLRPVVSVLEISRIEPLGKRASLIAGKATKLRACRYVSIAWHLGQERIASVPVGAAFNDAPEIRGTGPQRWVGLEVDLPPGVLQESSFAYVTHDCGWPWLVETLFWRAERPAEAR